MCWTVKLSDGCTIYESEDYKWLDLKKHIEDNHLSIIELSLNYNNNIVKISGLADGYTFSKGLSAYPGEKSEYYYVVGKLRGDLVHVNWWRLPRLIHAPQRKEVRPVSKYSKLLIRNYHE